MIFSEDRRPYFRIMLPAGAKNIPHAIEVAATCGDRGRRKRKNFSRFCCAVDEKTDGNRNKNFGGCRQNRQRANSCKALAMREWIVAVAPLTAVIYFLVFPDQLGELVRWLAVYVP